MRKKAAWQTWLIFVYLMSSFVKIPFFWFFLIWEADKKMVAICSVWGAYLEEQEKSLQDFPGLKF